MFSSSRFFDRSTPPHIFTLIVAAAVSSVGMNILLPALGEMAEHFATNFTTIQYAVSGYLAATALLQLLIGPLSDRFGRRPVMLWGFALFILFSLVCAMAPNFEIFIAARMAQAVVATGIVLSRTIIRDRYAQDKAASMIGYVTMGMAVAPMLGPAVG
ncbi:MAG: MFS transporter, partial [Pseudomonadota bacterium]